MSSRTELQPYRTRQLIFPGAKPSAKKGNMTSPLSVQVVSPIWNSPAGGPRCPMLKTQQEAAQVVSEALSQKQVIHGF